MDTICETMMDLTWNVDLPRPSSQRLSAKKDCISWAPSLKPVYVSNLKGKIQKIKIKRQPYSHLRCLLTAVHVWRPCKKCSIIKSSREVLPIRTRIDSTDGHVNPGTPRRSLCTKITMITCLLYPISWSRKRIKHVEFLTKEFELFLLVNYNNFGRRRGYGSLLQNTE